MRKVNREDGRGKEQEEEREEEEICSPSFSSAALTDLVHVCATFAMVVGSELHDQAVLPRDHFIIKAMLQSAVS